MSDWYSAYSLAQQRIAERLREAAHDQLIATAQSRRRRGVVQNLIATALRTG